MTGASGLDGYRVVVTSTADGPAGGVVLRQPGVVLVAQTARPSARALTAELLALCGEVTTDPSPAGAGRRLLRKVAGLLASAEPDDVPDFGLLVAAGDRIAALVHGETDITAGGGNANGGGESVRLSGAESATWIDRLLPAGLSRIDVGATGTAGGSEPYPDTPFDLRIGAVPGNGATLLLVQAGPGVVWAKASGGVHAGPLTGGEQIADVPVPAPPRLSQLTDPHLRRTDTPSADAPGADIPGYEADEAPAQSELAGRDDPRAPDAGGGAAVDGFLGGAAPPQFGDVRREPGPPTWDGDEDPPTDLGGFVGGYEDPVTELAGDGLAGDRGYGDGYGDNLADSPTVLPDMQPQGGSGPRILGIRCEHGHFNNPNALYCADCDVSLARVRQPEWGTRPTLGTLMFDDGSTVTVDTDIILGRQPDRHDMVQAGRAKPLVVEDGESAVSRIHADITIDGWEVRITDRGSANGTYIAPPNATVWSALTPHEPSPLTSGTRVQIGKRTFVFESRYVH